MLIDCHLLLHFHDLVLNGVDSILLVVILCNMVGKRIRLDHQVDIVHLAFKITPLNHLEQVVVGLYLKGFQRLVDLVRLCDL